MVFGCIFFFKQKTAYEMRISDWSSDVCSSDLSAALHLDARIGQEGRRLNMDELNVLRARAFARARDEERRPQDVMALVRQKQIRGAYAEAAVALARTGEADRSEEHTSELQSLMRISYAVFCLKKKKNNNSRQTYSHKPQDHNKHR